MEALLEALGVPFLHAPAEAEAQCAFLCAQRLVDAVCSDDSDVLVFGAREVYRRMFAEDQMVECYSQQRLKQHLGLRHEQLVALAMLLGCDYTLGVHGVGIVNALEVVQAYSPEGDGLEEWLTRLESFKAWSQNVAGWGQESLTSRGFKRHVLQNACFHTFFFYGFHTRLDGLSWIFTSYLPPLTVRRPRALKKRIRKLEHSRGAPVYEVHELNDQFTQVLLTSFVPFRPVRSQFD